jgi:ABC-2 type transport system ATP-binding protein
LIFFRFFVTNSSFLRLYKEKAPLAAVETIFYNSHWKRKKNNLADNGDDMDAVSIEKVCKSFGDVCAVNHLDVHIPSGSIYGFLGPNGAGKTTTIRMMMNIIRPDSGSIRIFDSGFNVNSTNRIGYMPEERGLYRKMTVRKVLAYFGAIKGMTNDAIDSSVTDWLRRIDLASWADKKVEELSRGMHQKLQFAVTVINNPELIILDEPFSGLDPINQELLKTLLLQMRGEGKTIIFSTHAMHEAEELCDYILLINKGKAVLDGPLQQIRSQYSSQVVCVRIDGDGGFIKTLPMVRSVETRGDQLEVTLVDGDSQMFLRKLVERTSVRSFNVKMPSLHEIFIKVVGEQNAENH